jgi:hypothetical protein
MRQRPTIRVCLDLINPERCHGLTSFHCHGLTVSSNYSTALPRVSVPRCGGGIPPWSSPHAVMHHCIRGPTELRTVISNQPVHAYTCVRKLAVGLLSHPQHTQVTQSEIPAIIEGTLRRGTPAINESTSLKVRIAAIIEGTPST